MMQLGIENDQILLVMTPSCMGMFAITPENEIKTKGKPRVQDVMNSSALLTKECEKNRANFGHAFRNSGYHRMRLFP